jgi:hypothetical protein
MSTGTAAGSLPRTSRERSASYLPHIPDLLQPLSSILDFNANVFFDASHVFIEFRSAAAW